MLAACAPPAAHAGARLRRPALPLRCRPASRSRAAAPRRSRDVAAAAARDGWPTVRPARPRQLLPPHLQNARTLASPPAQPPATRSLRRTRADASFAPFPLQPFRSEAASLLDALLTRQAVRTLVHYCSETNGEMHLFLNGYLAEHPLVVDDKGTSRAWLAELAAQPLTTVAEPGRSSAPSPMALAQVTEGLREVSPRDCVERIMALRLDIADEFRVDLDRTAVTNAEILRAALARTLAQPPPLED